MGLETSTCSYEPQNGSINVIPRGLCYSVIKLSDYLLVKALSDKSQTTHLVNGPLRIWQATAISSIQGISVDWGRARTQGRHLIGNFPTLFTWTVHLNLPQKGTAWRSSTSTDHDRWRTQVFFQVRALWKPCLVPPRISPGATGVLCDVFPFLRNFIIVSFNSSDTFVGGDVAYFW